MSALITQTWKSPFGHLTLGAFEDQLCLCDWTYRKMRTSVDQRISKILDAPLTQGDHPLFEQTKTQLEQYAQGQRKHFDLPLRFAGSTFQQSVWEALLRVPYGSTSSYLELSKSLGDAKAIRAVATANGANALAILVPCHRIIGADGSLVGYAGGLSTKKRLLQLEGALPQMELFA